VRCSIASLFGNWERGSQLTAGFFGELEMVDLFSQIPSGATLSQIPERTAVAFWGYVAGMG
jgi:hypothetical protein